MILKIIDTKILLRLALTFVFCVFPMFSCSAQPNCDTLDVVILGDSNTSIGGDNCQKPRGWNTWFRQALRPRSCRSYARSGATWTHTPETVCDTVEKIGVIGPRNVIYNQIMRLKNDVEAGRTPVPHLIIVAAGTNDAWFEDKRPGAFVMDENLFSAKPEPPCAEPDPASMLTMQKAVMADCGLLQRLFPKARVVLFTPLQSTAISMEQLQKPTRVLEACGKALNLSVVRQDEVCVVKRAQEQKKRRFTYDGTHTSEAGARQNGQILADIIKKLLTVTPDNK